MMTPESWTIRHFSQANPQGAEQGDVPALLRRVARTLEEFGHTVHVQDITFGTEVTELGEWPSLTVYFHEEDQETADGPPPSRDDA